MVPYQDDDEIVVIEEVYNIPPKKKLLRIISRVLTETHDTRYLVIWAVNTKIHCTLESIADLLKYNEELTYLQLHQNLLDKLRSKMSANYIDDESKYRLNENLPDSNFFSDIETNVQNTERNYWRLKRLEISWLQTIRKFDISSSKNISTPPLYIDGWFNSMYRYLPNFKYLIDGYAWSQKAKAIIKFFQNKRRTRECLCCGCEDGCRRCDNTKGTFLRIKDNLAEFPEEVDEFSEYFWTYECNHFCKCKTRCQYRMLKRGRKTPLIVTYQGSKGWILRAMETIKAGEFISEFLGEIISEEEASERSTNYQMVMERGFYLDCDSYGNESRFISHSCDPNAAVVRIFGIKNSYVFRMAVVAKRDILAGGEITIDYHPGADMDALTKEGSKCFCRTKKCRKWL